MNKLLKIENFLILAGILLICGFAIRLGADVYKIHSGINSEPLNLLLFERALEYLLPSILCFAASVFIKRRKKARR